LPFRASRIAAMALGSRRTSRVSNSLSSSFLRVRAMRLMSRASLTRSVFSVSFGRVFIRSIECLSIRKLDVKVKREVLTLCGCSQCFFVENLSPGMGESFEVFVARAADPAGKAKVEVVETSLRLE